MFCKMCGKSIPDGANNCPYCGVTLNRVKPNENTETPKENYQNQQNYSNDEYSNPQQNYENQ